MEGIDEDMKPSYECFDRGSEDAPTRSCSQLFLDQLIKDLELCSRAIFLDPPTHNNPNLRISAESRKAVLQVFTIMNECRRLRSIPNLFPSSSSRLLFLKKIALMSKNLAAFKAVINTAENTVVQLQNFSQHKGGRPKLAKRVGGIWFKVRPHHDVDDENRDPGIWCSYHPNGQRKDRPWKKFLENANFQALDGSLNHKITQLMPISGLKMLRRNQSMYQVVRRTFAAAQRVTRHHPKDKYELSQATGEDYNMLHVEHDVGAQTTFPFFTGEKKKYDSKGVVTLEYLSKAFHAFQRRRHLNPTDRFIGGKLVRV